MTIYGTPGGTTLNTTPFQGTQPGNAVQATLPGVTPGVGMFPPNSNNNSGDTVLAAAARAVLPLTALTTTYGQKHHSGPPGVTPPGRTIMDCLVDVDQNGAGGTYQANGGSPEAVINGGNSLGAGGANQTPGGAGGEGEASIMPTAAPANNPSIPSPVQYGG